MTQGFRLPANNRQKVPPESHPPEWFPSPDFFLEAGIKPAHSNLWEPQPKRPPQWGRFAEDAVAAYSKPPADQRVAMPVALVALAGRNEAVQEIVDSRVHSVFFSSQHLPDF